MAALKILAECLGKGEKTLPYIYEEYSVSYFVLLLDVEYHSQLFILFNVAYGET